MDVNTVLYTRDGLLIGNSIIVKKYDDEHYRIKTDYGNEVDINIRQIRNQFHETTNIGLSHKHSITDDNYENNFSPNKWKYLNNKI